MPGSPAAPPPARLAVMDRVRQGDHTVNAIAAALSITDNAVRLHLGALERDGLLLRRGIRRSGHAGQPAAEYGLTSSGEIALSSAYPPALAALVAALAARLEPRAARALFLDAGRRLAGQNPPQPSGASVAVRAKACAALLESLGGRVSVKVTNGHAVLEGAGCPLSEAVRAEPGTCAMVEALLEQSSGLSVTQCCNHGEHPACRFEFEAKARSEPAVRAGKTPRSR